MKRDNNGKVIRRGQIVVVPVPSLPDDFWKHCFQGRVHCIKPNGLVCVVDQHDNGWDVEPDVSK